MTEPTQRAPSFDDAPTTPMPQEPYGSSTGMVPPTAPQQVPPPAWQPAGLSGSQSPQAQAPSSLSWTPAGQAPEQPRGSGRGRWIVALFAALVLVVAGIGVAIFALGSKSTASVGPTFLPASTAIYAEARLDLPGTQRNAVVKLFSHFPGFADQAAFDLKVDETLDKLVGQAAGGIVSYSRDIKPWFSGQVAIGLLELPPQMTGLGAPSDTPPSSGSITPDSAVGNTHVLIGIGVKDRSKLDTLLITVRAFAGSTFTEEQYGDDTIVSVGPGDAPQAVYAVTDTLLLVAPSPADLKKGLDVLAGKTPALAADAVFMAAMKDLPQDRLGAYYVDPAVYQAAADTLKNLGSFAFGSGTSVDAMKCIQPTMPDPARASSSGAIVAAGDNVAIELRANNGGAQPARVVTDLAAHQPADTMFYMEVPKVGGSIHSLVDCLRGAMPEVFANPQLGQVEQLLGTKIEDYLSFVTDLGIGASYDGAKFHWGVVAGVDNEDTAKQRVTGLIAFVKLAANLGGAPISVTEQQVNGVTISTITLSDIPGVANLPIDPSISIAVSGGHLYIGGGDFASTALSRSAADSLASNQRFSSALAAVGNPNGVTLYLDIDAVRQRIEAVAPMPQSYAVDTQPYLKPFDRLIIGSSTTGETTTGRILLFVK